MRFTRFRILSRYLTRPMTLCLRIFGFVLLVTSYMGSLLFLDKSNCSAATPTPKSSCPATLPALGSVNYEYISKCQHCYDAVKPTGTPGIWSTPGAGVTCSRGDKVTYSGSKGAGQEGYLTGGSEFYKISSGYLGLKVNSSPVGYPVAVSINSAYCKEAGQVDIDTGVNYDQSFNTVYIRNIGVTDYCSIDWTITVPSDFDGDYSATVNDGYEYNCQGAPTSTPTQSNTPTVAPTQSGHYYKVTKVMSDINYPVGQSGIHTYDTDMLCAAGDSLQGISIKVYGNFNGQLHTKNNEAGCSFDQYGNPGEKRFAYTLNGASYAQMSAIGFDLGSCARINGLTTDAISQLHFDQPQGYYGGYRGDVQIMCYGNQSYPTATPTATATGTAHPGGDYCSNLSNSAIFKPTGTYQVVGANLPVISTATFCIGVVPQITFAVGGQSISVPNVQVCNHPVLLGAVEILGFIVPNSLLVISALVGLIALILSI